MTIPDMVCDGLCFLSQQNMSSIIAWKIHLVPVHSDMVFDGLCTVLSAKDEFLNLIDIIAWKIHLVSVYIQYILMTIPDMVCDGLCFLSQKNMSLLLLS